MPDLTRYTRITLEKAAARLRERVYTNVGDLAVTAWRTHEPVPFPRRREGKELHLRLGDSWGRLFDCAWFRFQGTVPASAAGMPVVLRIDVNGELCIVDSGGNPVRGLTNAASVFDPTLGKPGKCVIPLSELHAGGGRFEAWADAGCNDLFGNLSENGTIKEASIAVLNPDIRALWYDFEVLLDFLGVLPQDSPRFRRIVTALGDAAWTLAPEVTPENARAASRILSPVLRARGGDPELRISAIGHAHLDLGWLWPIRETQRKGARTFATALANMELYPDYVFGASQAQLFQWMKELYPGLYARMKKRARDGRLEPQGAMWVEADTNLIGSESMVRQILHGKRFFRAEFGVDPRCLWLPDVFGYSGALPQMLRKSGVEYFVTQKLSWNLINLFPHHSFRWQGIDGSSVLAHMLPEDTYNGPALPRSVRTIEKGNLNAGVSQNALMVFGIGDGGGGPGEEHLERLNRMRNLSGLSPVKQEWSSAFLKRWARDAERFPAWVGELYLERHQGTFTTEAPSKAANRRIETALRDLEWLASMDSVLNGAPYPADRLDAVWKEVLLYQFHDILPGSSIKRVYDESLPRYKALLEEVQELADSHRRNLARKLGAGGGPEDVIVFNSLSWPREEWMHIRKKWIKVRVPAMGCKAVSADAGDDVPAGVNASARRLENDRIRVSFHPDGSISSVYDKASGREVVPRGGRANRLAVYRDTGDVWDFPLEYAKQTPRYFTLVSSKPRVDGPRAVMEQVYALGNSRLTQEIVITAGSPRVDFFSRLSWLETASMLRTGFPVDVHAEEAAYEIQFGHIRRPAHRNTSWDMAKDEVPAHRWADLSQGDYGVALLNDCKYGYKIKDGVIELDLIRSVPYPGPRLVPDEEVEPGSPHHAYTDQGEHAFSYALYPHRGDLVSGNVVRAGYEFNIPLATAASGSRTARGPREASYLEVDAPNVVVEAVKKAEDSDETIIRLYESAHAAARATLTFAFPVKSAWEVDLMEEHPRPLKLKSNGVRLDFRPFEIKTVRLRTG
jgi:alpha-mannosidase